MQKISYLLFVFLLFLVPLFLFSQNVQADEVTDNPFPAFQLIYNEFDAPIHILSADLISEDYTIPVNYTSNQGKYIFTFSSNTYLLNGEYTLKIVAEDKDGNTQVYEDTIEVDADVMKIWVEDPKHEDYEDKFQDVAMRTSIPFNFTMKTEYDSICRIRKSTGSFTNIPALYENFMLTSFNDGDMTPTKTHNLHVVEQGASSSFPPNSFVTVAGAFDNSNYELKDSFLVVCKQEVAGGSPVYHPKMLYIGYDPENSGFEAHFTPEIIQDTAALRTNLHIESNEDLQSCHYNFIGNPSPSYLTPFGPIASSYPVTSIHEFDTSYDKEFSFQTQLQDFDIGEQKDYAVNVTCYDAAYKPISHVEHFSVNLTTAFDITLPQSHFADKKPTLNFVTSLKSSCMYEFTYKDQLYTDFIGDELNLTNNHELELPVKVADDGIYSIDLFCTADTLEQQSFQFTIDTIPPKAPVIISNDFYCDEGLGLDILAPINDTVQYNITLYNGTGTSGTKLLDGFMSSFTSGNFTFSLPSNIETNVNSTYTWSVIALDQGGLTSGTPVSKTVTILEPSALSCDVNPPYGSATIKKVDQGYSYNISCMDLESGCSPNFKYGIVPEGTNCSSTQLTLGTYGLPLTSMSDGILCYSVFDNAGNEWNGTKKLSSSVPADLTLIHPKFGIANTKDFLFSIQTNKELTCKFGPNTQGTSSDDALLYASLEPFSMTGGLEHSTKITSSNYPSFDTTQAEQTVPWVVICTDGTQYFKSLIDEFGYDVTPPVLDVSISPNPVTDATNQDISISVSADDEVVCTYLGNDEVPKGFTDYDPNKRTSYTSSHSISMSYTGINNEDVLQKIKCRNVAQSVNENNKTVHVEPANSAEIKTNSLYSKTNSFSLSATTSTDANCVYQLNNAGTFENFQSTGTTIHKKIISLSNDKTPILIQCTSGKDISSYYGIIVLDSIKPTLQILSPSTSCSSSEIKASFIASGTGSPIENYNYDLTDASGTVIKAGEISKNEISISEGLISGETYTLSVSVTDKAGNVQEASKQITLGSGTGAFTCDSLAPSASVKNSVSWGKTLSTITCEDNNNDCTTYFTYFLDEKGICDQNQNSEMYSNQPLEIIKPTTLCYTVYDSDNNKFSSSEPVPLYLQCFNGIEDPDEQGVDCGGPCAATCGLCDNGVQDPFEEGVDCGQVCQTEKECMGNTQVPVVQDNECEIDSDCDSGYYCSFRNQCVKESNPSTTQPTYADTSGGMNPLGLVLLILGLLFMGAGAGYIYYSQKKKIDAIAATTITQSQQQAQNMSAQQKARAAQIAARQREAAKRKAELFAQQKAKQGELEKERIEERKNKRSSLLGVFGTGKDTSSQDKKTKTTKKSDEINTIKETLTAKNKAVKKELFKKEKAVDSNTPNSKMNSKNDSSQTDEYLDVSSLSEKSPTKTNAKSSLDSEDALSKLSHLKDKETLAQKEKILFSEKTNPKEIRINGVKNSQSSSQSSLEHKPSVFDTIDSLAQKSNLSSNPNEDYFTTLENTIEAAHGKSNDEIIESLATTIGNIQGKLDPDEFVKKFSKSALTKKLAPQTKKDLIALLVKEKKLSTQNAKTLLEKIV